mgnify:CR=1 FL=1
MVPYKQLNMIKIIFKKTFKNIKEKLYFSRRKFGKAAATEFGEEYIEQCFNQNGYESLGPETLTLREQIYVWNHAEAIACMNGTIPLNVVFAKRRIKINNFK